MVNERVERRLSAILAADVAGYSRLTGLDEEGTHVQLQDHLRTLVDPKIAEHRGRVVKNTGDGLLAEFSSVVDAVRAVERVGQLDRRRCRAEFERRFTAARMAQDYLAIYRKILPREEWPRPAFSPAEGRRRRRTDARAVLSP